MCAFFISTINTEEKVVNLRTPRASREKKKDGDREFAKPPSHNNPAKMRIKMPAVRIAQGKEEKEEEENCVGWKSRPATHPLLGGKAGFKVWWCKFCPSLGLGSDVQSILRHLAEEV